MALAVITVQAPAVQAQSLGGQTITLNYNNNKVTFSVNAPGGTSHGWWYKIVSSTSNCSSSPNDPGYGNYQASGSPYSRTITGNGGKYICIRHRKLSNNPNNAFTVGTALITYPPDTSVPTVTRASVNGASLTVTFSEDMSSSKAANSTWSVSVAGSSRSISSYTLSGTTATLTLAGAVNASQTVTLGYTKPGSGSKLQDTAGNDLATFSGQAVTNSTPYPTVEAERSTNQLTIYEGDTATFTYVLKANPYADRTIQIAPDHDDLKIVKGDGSKVDELTLTFTDDDWDDAQTVTLSVEEDSDRNDVQGAQDVNFTLHDKLTHASGSNATLTVQMLDDDASPALTLSETSLSVDEGGSDTFTVRLAGRPNANVTVSLVQQSNAANSEVTFTPASLAFTTSNWHTTQTVTVNAAEDDDAGDDIATISLSASGGDYGSVTGNVTITVDDDDDIDGVRASFNPVNLADITATEGMAVARSLALGRQPDANVTVALASNNTEVTFASDSAGSTAITSMSFTRSNWNTAQTFYTVLGDDSDSNNDTASVTLTASGGGFAGVTTRYGVTVIDTDSPTIIPSISPVILDEDGSAVTVGVQLSEVPTIQGSFGIGPINSFLLHVTSSDPSVFTVAPSFLVFDSHDSNSRIWSNAQDLTITPVNDGTFTSAVKNATINIKADSAFPETNYGRAVDTTFTIPVQVRDDDSPPGLTLSGASLTVDEGGSDTFTVRLASKPSANVTVTLSQPRSAPNADVTFSPASLTFASTNWYRNQTVTVRAAEDADAGDDIATISLNASGGGYGSVTGSLAITVEDDDDIDGVRASFNPVNLADITATEGSAVARSLALGRRPSTNVTVALASTNSEVTFASDSGGSTAIISLSFTRANWNTAQTFYTVLGDDSDSNNDTAEVTLSASSGGFSGVTTRYGVTVIDTDSPTIIPSVSPVVLDEDGSAVTVGVQLSEMPTIQGSFGIGPINSFLLHVTSSDPSVFTVAPSFLVFDSHDSNSRIWSNAQDLTITPVNDGTFTSAVKNATINIKADSAFPETNYGRAVDTTFSIPVQIRDDDPALTLSEASLTLSENGSNTFTVRLANRPSAQVMVTLARTGASSADVTATPSPLTFTTDNWSAAQTVTVSAADDDDAADDTATIDLTASGGDYAGITGSVQVTVRDNDKIELTLSAASLEIEEDDKATFTVALDSIPSDDVTVTLSQPDDDTNADVTIDTDAKTTGDQNKLTFTTDNWDDPQTVTVSAADDADAVADTATIKLTAEDGGYDNVEASVEVSVTETDTAGLDISESSLEIDEDNNATFTVRLTSQPSDDVTVTFAQPTDNGPANADVTIDTDSETNGDQNELTFTTSNWSDTQTVTVSAVDDDDGDDDMATINLSATGGDYAGKTGSVEVTVDDDDGFELSVSRLVVNENSNATFTVKLTSQPSDDVTVTLKQPSDGTANDEVTIDTDTGTNGNQNTLTFTTGNWDDTQSVTVSAAEDGDIDDDTARINLTAAGGGYGQVTASLDVSVDDDDAVELALSTTTLTVTEGSDNTFTVALDSVPNADVTVRLAQPSPGTNSDVRFNPASLDFTATDWNKAQTVTVSAAEDADDSSETATIDLTAEGGNYDGKTASVTVTVTDDDNRFVLTPVSLTVAEGGSNTFTVALRDRPAGNVTVMLAQPSATENTDVTFTPTELTFTTANWNRTQTVTVNAAEDADAVVDRATIKVSAKGGGYDRFTASVAVSVTETDTAGFKLLDSADAELTGLKVTEGDSALFKVKLDSQPSAQVKVTLASGNSDVTLDTDTGTTGNQDELTFTADNWDDPQTVTVSAGEDDDGDDETAVISLSASGAGEYASVTGSLDISIEDDDDAALTVTPTDLTVAEGGETTFTIRLATAPSGTVSVALASSDDDVTLDPASISFTASDWKTPKTITVRAAADDDSVSEEDVTISLTAEDGGYDGVTGSVTVDVTDTTPRLILTPTELTIDEGQSKVFTAQLSRAPQNTTTIALESDKEDIVTLSLTSLTFTTSNWNAARTITVQTARDPDPTDDEAVVSLTGDGIVTGTVTVTVTDDGKIGLDLSAEELTVVEGEQGSFTVKLHAEPSANLSVALESSNPEVTLSSTSLTFTTATWNTAQTVTVIAADDEDNEDDTATISLTGSGVIEDSVTVKVTDDDTGATLEAEQAAAAVILAEVVGALLPAAGDAIGRRFDSPRSGRTATVAGRQVALDRSLAEDLAAGFAARAGVRDASQQSRFAEDSFGAERHSIDWLGGIPLDAGRPLRSVGERSSGMSAGAVLLSDFSYALNAGAAGGAGWSIWGRLDTGEFSGSNDGVEFDSSSSNVWFGADRRGDSGTLSGVAYSSSGSDADYTLGQFGAALETDLTLVLPYLETEFDGGATGHAMLGVGSGEATITQTDKQQGSADLSVYMITAGGSWPTLWEIGSAALSWSGDFGYTALTTSGSELPSLDGLSVSSMQLRGGLELRFDELGYGWKTTPHAALLMRLDSGDGVTGTGFELTGGLQMASGSSDRFSLDLNLRTLVMHSAEELTDWGASIQVRIKPFGDGSGLGFALGPHWGAPEGDGLLQRDEAFRLDQAGRQQRQLRQQSRGLTADLGYGLRAFGGMLTPYSEYRFTSGEHGSIRQLAGVRFSNSAALELRLFTERHIARLGETRSRLAVELQKRY